MNLLTVNNYKLSKSKEFGYKSAGLSLVPNIMNSKGINLCGKDSESCRSSCIVFSGMNSMTIQSKVKRTDLFLNNRILFLQKLLAEIGYEYELAKIEGLKLSVRLNMYSDIDWSKLKFQGKNVYEWYPQVTFIEYTRHWKRVSKYPNLFYTYSADKANISDQDIINHCKKGLNVSMVFLNKPEYWNGIKVVDGDTSDLRHLDERGVIVALQWKNAVKKGIKNIDLQKDNTILYN